MTLREAYSLADYWAEFPPMHEVGRMFATAYLGWTPKAAASGERSSAGSFKESSEAEIRAFVAAAKSAGG
jgi:hypothetical protein